jgi:predicted dinucleotide-binding enzyme
MRIGIIGAGNIGGTLVRRFRALGHQVRVSNAHGAESLAGLAAETGARAVDTEDAVSDVDLVVVSIPEKEVSRLPAGLFADAPEGLVVVDTGNYYPRERDGLIAGIEGGMPESVWVEQQIGWPVVKAFNTLPAAQLGDAGLPRGAPDRMAIPVAGDGAESKTIVMKLVDELGFVAVDAGDLDGSWRQQPGTPVYGRLLDAAGVRRALAEAKPGRSAAFSAAS